MLRINISIDHFNLKLSVLTNSPTVALLLGVTPSKN